MYAKRKSKAKEKKIFTGFLAILENILVDAQHKRISLEKPNSPLPRHHARSVKREAKEEC